jgi:hypothetical protein
MDNSSDEGESPSTVCAQVSGSVDDHNTIPRIAKKGPTIIKSSAYARHNAEKAMRSYYRRKRRKKAGPVANLVEDAVANVLKVVRREARMRRQIKAQNKKKKERMATDPVFKARIRLMDRLHSALKNYNIGFKVAATMKLVGASIEEVHKHLEQSRDGKIGDLHIDHIFPFYSYNDISTLETQMRVMHISNLQFLTQHENCNKNCRLPTKAMAAKVDRDKWPPGITEDMLLDIYPGWSTPLRM